MTTNRRPTGIAAYQRRYLHLFRNRLIRTEKEAATLPEVLLRDLGVLLLEGLHVRRLDTFEAHVVDVYDRQVYVAMHDDVPAAESRTAIEAAVADWPNATIDDQAEFKETVTQEIDQILNLIYGLLALAVVIALIGIANTLALSVHERRREIGLLRAVGMSRSQVRRTVRWEAVAIALLGTAMGTALAVAGAWGIIQALGSEVTAFTVPGLVVF